MLLKVVTIDAFNVLSTLNYLETIDPKFVINMSWLPEERVPYTWWQSLCLRILRCGDVPQHVAFIMDGNRRFAREKNLQKIEGHIQGFEKLAQTLQWCNDLGIKQVTVYAFR